MTRLMQLAAAATVAAAVFLGVGVTERDSADAIIHEMIGAACNADSVGEITPPGQLRGGQQSFARALFATGLIASLDFSVEGQVTVNFDLDVPSSKYTSAGFDLTIPDGFGEGTDLVLSPLPVPDPDFAAHANCKNPEIPE